MPPLDRLPKLPKVHLPIPQRSEINRAPLTRRGAMARRPAAFAVLCAPRKRVRVCRFGGVCARTSSMCEVAMVVGYRDATACTRGQGGAN